MASLVEGRVSFPTVLATERINSIREQNGAHVGIGAAAKLMTTYHWPLEAGIIVGEQKANVKERGDWIVGQFDFPQ
jgi:hypothetical protein